LERLLLGVERLEDPLALGGRRDTDIVSRARRFDESLTIKRGYCNKFSSVFAGNIFAGRRSPIKGPLGEEKDASLNLGGPTGCPSSFRRVVFPHLSFIELGT
jgi:hypothetical protein